MALGRPAQGVFEVVRPPLRARVPSDYLKLAPVQLDGSIHLELDENLGPRLEGDDGRRKSSTLPRRWLRLDPSRHGWPCVVTPWRSSGAMPWIHQGTCTLNGDINLILSSL